jgi:DNA polymerase
VSLSDLYEEMKGCNACKMRAGCTQVVPGAGQVESPILLVVGEAPGGDEDLRGEPFVGQAGQVLRQVLRQTGVLNRTNTLISNTIKCRPPNNKFPKDDSAQVCVAKWLWREIELAKPKRLLLLGNTPLKYVAGLEGITSCRGNWYDVRGIRTMATYHPSYVMRNDSSGEMFVREMFERDIREVADEVRGLIEGGK